MKILAKKNIIAKTDEEVVTILANMLLNKGVVKESFLQRIIERERVFPTGLRLKGDIDVALPHADVEHCISKGLAVGVLETPVKFHEMASDPKGENLVDAKIVMVFATEEADKVVSILGKLVNDVFMKPDVVRSIYKAKDEEEIARILNEALKLN